MKRKFKGVSEIIGVAILIIAAIAIAVGLYLYAQRFTGGADVVQAQALMVQNTYAGGNQIAVASIRLTSKTSSTLFVSAVVARITYANGNIGTAVFGTTSATSPMTLPVSANNPTATVDGTAQIDAGRTVELTVTFRTPINNQIRSVVFTVYLVDPAGNIRTVTTNEVIFT